MRNRSVVEIMVIVFTLVIAFSVLATGALVAILEIRDPTVETESTVDVLYGILTTIVGALLGLLAGKSETTSGIDQRLPDPRWKEWPRSEQDERSR